MGNRTDGAITVLLIEDDPMVQQVNRMFIDKVEGFEVVGVASNGEEGKERIIQMKPDLVLLDIYMPKQDGLGLLQELRQEQLDIDIIAVTAANDTATVKTLLRLGVVDYIVKPFTFERLQKALTQYKNVFRKINEIDKFSQDTLDVVMKQDKLQKEAVELPKGLHAQTMTQILEHVQSMDTAKSAEEIGSQIGLARVTVRRYLTYLESIGKVEMELTYGTIGRPIQTYRKKV